ncbi:kinase/pyrophosphorylase [Marinilabiliaceae bacterium JC017]|nr:kinase/pyrophosphorylase [Marinilabiliaceae bacterium JC017]
MPMNTSTPNKKTPIYVVSGGKGLAGHTMVNSLLIQYPQNKLPIIVMANVQNQEKIEEVVLKAKYNNGLVTHTMVNTNLRNALIETCRRHGVREIDFMGSLAHFLENELGLKSINVPGLYRRINAQYFDRIEAIEYTMNHDDGLNPEKLLNSEIILTGVSRSGKTPLSVYMSMFGWKVANIPLIKGIMPPKELFEVDPLRVFGLGINLNQLISQRQKRLVQMKNTDNKTYVDPIEVRDEIRFANLIFDKGGFTRINVTNKPIETTANEIIGHISDRFGHQDRKLKTPDNP